MTRDEAVNIVEPHITKFRNFKCVSHTIALSLLGEMAFGKMLADPIRKHGPCTGTVYPWNLVDYLMLKADHPELFQNK